MSDSLTFKLAQAAAILSSAFASGGILTISFLMVPTLLLPGPSPIVKKPVKPQTTASHVSQQWLHAYDMGKRIYPAIVASSALTFTYVAYVLRSRPDKFSKLYLAAAAVSMAIVPYTLGIMMPTNKRLEVHAKRGIIAAGLEPGAEGKEGRHVTEEERVKMDKEDEEIPGLMVKWAWLNVVRGFFPLAGAAIGVTAALN